jgi:hypothetical protein
MVAAAVIGAGLGGALLSSSATKSAANTASDAQSRAAQLGIDQQNKQFESVQRLLSPFVTAGMGGLTGQQDLLGLNGMQAQQTAIGGIQNSPQFAAMQKAGNDNILANASATGGLRGGNVQGALAQFSPSLLSSLIDQQYQRLGGLTSLGQNAAAGVGNAGMATGTNISTLLGQQGSALAGGALLNGRADVGMVNSLNSQFGSFAGMGGIAGINKLFAAPPGAVMPGSGYTQPTGIVPGAVDNVLF